MSNIRTIIVDDESLARRGLAIRLQDYADIEIVAQCKNGREALEAIQTHSPDLVFLDIQMPGIDGFEVVRNIQTESMPLIVFATAFDHYAVDAFQVHAIDYVLKPVDAKRLDLAIGRVRQHLEQSIANNQKQRLLDLISNITGETPSTIKDMLVKDSEKTSPYPEKISIKDGSETSLVTTRDIDWIDAAGDYMCLHADDKVHVLRSTMKKIEEKLDPKLFQRIHRSTIVNLEKIEKVCSHINGEFFIIVKGGARLKMSRSYRDKIKHII